MTNSSVSDVEFTWESVSGSRGTITIEPASSVIGRIHLVFASYLTWVPTIYCQGLAAKSIFLFVCFLVRTRQSASPRSVSPLFVITSSSDAIKNTFSEILSFYRLFGTTYLKKSRAKNRSILQLRYGLLKFIFLHTKLSYFVLDPAVRNKRYTREVSMGQ